MRDFFFFRKEERHAREELDAVAIAHKRLSSSTARTQRWAYHVEVELKRRKSEPILVGLADTIEEARALATEVAGAAGLPIVDRTEEVEQEDEEVVEES